MTVHVHKTIGGIHIGGHHHRRDKSKKGRNEALDTERTWAFDCNPACERRVVNDEAFAATHASGVPLTVDEEIERADLETEARIESAQVARALSDVARERIASTGPAKAGTRS